MLKSIITEGLGVLNPGSITIYFFQLFLTLIMVIVLKQLFKLKYSEKIEFPLMSYSIVLTMLLPFVKFSTPLAIVLLGLIVLFQNSMEFKRSEIPFLMVGLGTALSIGAGFWILGLGGFCFAVVVLLLGKK